jgi:uncharacterized membrane protein
MKALRLSHFIFFAATLLFVVSVTLTAAALPDRIATHFDATGEANGWMSRTGHIGGFLALGLGVSAFILGIAYAIRFFPSSTLNVPRQAYWRTPENYPRACAFFFSHTFWLAALNMLFMTALHQSVVIANTEAPPALLMSAVTVSTGVFLAGLFVWSVFLIRFFLKAPRA